VAVWASRGYIQKTVVIGSSIVSWPLSLELCDPLVEQIKLLRHRTKVGLHLVN